MVIITLQCCDPDPRTSPGNSIPINEIAARLSETLSESLDKFLADGFDGRITIPVKIAIGTLQKLVDWMKHHQLDSPVRDHLNQDDDFGERKTSPLISAWDLDFLNVELEEIVEILQAAWKLKIHGLIQIGAKHVANQIQIHAKSTEELRKFLNTHNDFTPEEEAEIAKQNKFIMGGHE